MGQGSIENLNRASTSAYLPYEELKLAVGDNGDYTITTPWLSFQINLECSPTVRETLSSFAAGDLGSVNFKILSDLLEQLNLPITYILPGSNNRGQGQDVHQIDRALSEGGRNLDKNEMRKFLGLDSVETAKNWNWDIEAILDFAKLPSLASSEKFDAQSLLSVVRRFHLLDCVDVDQTSQLYNNCLKGELSKRSDIQEILATIIYQNYFVTANCQESLNSALATAQSAEAKLQKFMQDEDGHDILLQRAFDSLTSAPHKLHLDQGTKNIMALLKKSGSLSFLSFCFAVDFFEKPSFSDVDPLAELLTAHGHEVAARCLQRHKSINDGGEHEGVALDFLASMASVDKEYAVFAIRLAEILSDEMVSITKNLLHFFEMNIINQTA